MNKLREMIGGVREVDKETKLTKKLYGTRKWEYESFLLDNT